MPFFAAAPSRPAGVQPVSGEKLALDQLCAVLEKEHTALMARDAGGITQSAAEKQAVLDQLAILVKSRTTRAGLSQARLAISQDPELRSAWKKVDAMNRANSAVLALHSAVVAQGLGVLRQAVGSDGTYNARGGLGGHYLASSC